MELNFHITFLGDGKNWLITESADTLIGATSIAKNVSKIDYSSGTTVVSVSLPDSTWHIFCNKPIQLEEVTNKTDLENNIKYYVVVNQ